MVWVLRSKTVALFPLKAEGNKQSAKRVKPALTSWQCSNQRNIEHFLTFRASKSLTENQLPRVKGTLDIWATPGLNIIFYTCSLKTQFVAWNFKNVLMCCSVHILIKSARFEHAKLKISPDLVQRYELNLLFSGKGTQGRMTKTKYFDASYDRKTAPTRWWVIF